MYLNQIYYFYIFHVVCKLHYDSVVLMVTEVAGGGAVWEAAVFSNRDVLLAGGGGDGGGDGGGSAGWEAMELRSDLSPEGGSS